MTTRERNKSKYPKTTNHFKKYKSNWDGIPAFLKTSEPQNLLLKHFFMSTIHHIIFFFILCGIFSFLKIGLTNPIFKSQKKVKDIEFVIKSSSSRGQTPKLSQSQATTEVEANNTPNVTTETNPNKVQNKTKNGFASIPVASPDDFSIPMPKFKSASSGSGRSGRRVGSGSSGSSSSDSNPSDIGSEYGTSSGIGSSKGTGFDKNAARKTITAYDISPYVNELKRNVKMNWRPAKNSDGKYVELFLRIAKDGRLIILNVKKTSESGDVDEAALNAVKKTLPLTPLPSKYSKSFLDLVFTFNSNSSSVGSRY